MVHAKHTQRKSEKIDSRETTINIKPPAQQVVRVQNTKGKSEKHVSQETMLKIVTHDGKNLVVNYEEIEKVIHCQTQAFELPIIALVIGGVQGTGKTFMLNLFLSYLKYTENQQEVGVYSR